MATLSGQRALGGGNIELHLAAEKSLRVEPAEHQIGVRHRRLGAAEAVAGRTGRRRRRSAGRRAAPRPRPARDRAAAGADLEDIHHGDLHRQRLLVTADQRRAGRQRLAVMNDAGFRGGAAHVEGDRVVDIERPAQRLRADDAGCRPGFQHAHALALRLLGLVKSAGRLHDQERAGKAGRAHVRIDLADVAADFRAHIGVGRDRRAALELAVFLRQFVRSGDEQAGMVLFQDRLGAPLVIGIGIAVEKQDGGGFDAERSELFAERRDFVFIQRRIDLAVGQHALVDLEAQRPLDQRHVLAEEQIVGVGPVDASDLVDVAKALGDEQRRARAGALEHRVDGDGRAVEKQRGGAVIAAGLGDACGNALDQMRRGRQRLAERELAGLFVKHRNVGERAADIGGKPQPSLRRPR